jgi:hypothetical protein
MLKVTTRIIISIMARSPIATGIPKDSDPLLKSLKKEPDYCIQVGQSINFNGLN